jgi:glycosyltransferase involved in cell wall biosynthesis
VISELNIPAANSIIVTTGRLTWLKGWKFMIDCFSVYEKIKPGSLFYLIGEGEDNQKIEEYLASNELSGKVILVGKQDPYVIAKYLNAADLFIMGSYKEGWSTSLIEAIACGIPACVTNFSSASTIIVEGINGYVIIDRNIDIFVNGMVNTLKMSRPIYNDNVKVFSTDKLKEDLLKIWKLI